MVSVTRPASTRDSTRTVSVCGVVEVSEAILLNTDPSHYPRNKNIPALIW